MHACQKRYLSSQHIYHTLFGHLSWPTVTCVSSHQLGWRLHEGDDFHPQENIDKMANGEPLTDQVSPRGGVSAADTECQSFTEPLFCHVNDGGDSTDRTQQVSQRCYIWADGKSSRHKDLCSFEGFTAACFNLYLFSFLLTVKLKRGGPTNGSLVSCQRSHACSEIGSRLLSAVSDDKPLTLWQNYRNCCGFGTFSIRSTQ